MEETGMDSRFAFPVNVLPLAWKGEGMGGGTSVPFGRRVECD